VQVGIVSYGPAECGTADHPEIGFYASIPYFRRWIDNTLKKYGL